MSTGLNEMNLRDTINLIEAKSQELINKLKSGEIDCCLLAMPINDENIIGEKIFSEKFLLATPKGHPFSKKRSEEHTSELQSH